MPFVQALPYFCAKILFMMKQTLLFSLLFLTPLMTKAQTQAETSLGEATVSATRKKALPNGWKFYPTTTQKDASTNGYDLLSKMRFPGIRVDEFAHTISAKGKDGIVIVQINGASATMEDLLALDPKTVQHIDFIDRPGVRYGVGTTFVIDVRIKKPTAGYAIGLDAKQGANVRTNNYTTFGKRFFGHSELGLTYNFAHNDYRHTIDSESTTYHLTDGTQRVVTRNDMAMRNRKFNNSLQLRYALADTTAYTFQATFSAGFNRTPADFKEWQTQVDNDIPLSSSSAFSNRSFSPSFSLFFYRLWPKEHRLTTNFSLSHIDTEMHSSRTEKSTYIYNVTGRSYALYADVTYEKRWEKHRLEAGLRQSFDYSHNRYAGNTEGTTPIHNAQSYAFAEWNATWRRWDLSLGIEGSRESYRQNKHRYCYWAFRPKGTLTYRPSDAMTLSYSVESSQYHSRVAFTSDARIRVNSMEWLVGNPDLRPNRLVEQSLSASISLPRFAGQLSANFRHHSHPNMALYLRTPQDEFIYMQTNQQSIDMFYITHYLNYTLLHDRLSLITHGGIYRCFNRGDAYRHHYTSADIATSLDAYIGRWTFTVAAGTGFRFLEGETKNAMANYSLLQCSYRWGNCTLGVRWNYPFLSSVKSNESFVLNQHLQRHHVQRDADTGNSLVFKFTWHINRGRQSKIDTSKAKEHKAQTNILGN